MFDCHFSLPVPAVYRPVLPPSPAGGVPCRGTGCFGRLAVAGRRNGAATPGRHGRSGPCDRPGPGSLFGGLPDLLHRRGRAGVPCVHGCDAVHRGPYRPGGVSLGADPGGRNGGLPRHRHGGGRRDPGLRSGGFRRAAGQLGRVRHRAGGREPGEAVGRGGGNTGVPGAAVPAAACGSHLHPQRGGLDAAHEERRRAAPDHDRGI